MSWKQQDSKYIAGTYARYDLEAVKGKGARCWDVNGKEYIDFTSGIGVNSLGFCDEDWAAAVSSQAQKLQHISNLYYTQPMEDLAQGLCQRTGMNKVFFCNSGAEANEGAIKTARKYSFDHYGKGRHKIVALENSFHGRTITTLSATGQAVFHQYFDPFTDGCLFAKANDIQDIKSKLSPDVCAVMVELIQGEGGVVPLREDFVREIAALCKEKDLLLIVDEVQTGMGRTGKLLCCEHYAIKPDIVTLAKGLGGGLPIGAVLLGEKCENTLGAGDHGTTYGGDPVACAGANVVLKKLDENLLEQISQKGACLKSRLLACKKVERVDGKGMMLGIAMKGKDSKQTAKECLERGLVVLTAKTKLRLLPPLNISREELEKGLAVLEEVLG